MSSGTTASRSAPRSPARLLDQGWRDDLGRTVRSARESVLLAAPYVKHDAAEWLRRQLPAGVALTVLTRIRADAIASEVLDITALLHLAEASETARIVALPNLHAKVFVADASSAIVTSGNLTRAGLDTNLECGVLLRESPVVAAVRDRMRSFARLGSEVGRGTLADLLPLEKKLRSAYAQSEEAVEPEASRQLASLLHQAKPRLVGTQVGNRSANAVFAEAIRFVLARGPRTTAELGPEVKQLLPDLCDDDEVLVINDESYGKKWKHRLRNAQQQLKRQGVVAYDPETKLWRTPLTPPKSPVPPPPSAARGSP